MPLSYLAAVLRACEPSSPKPAPGRDEAVTVPSLIEPLTSREMHVLDLLAAGSPNQQITNDLVVTIDTVKKHVQHWDRLGPPPRLRQPHRVIAWRAGQVRQAGTPVQARQLPAQCHCLLRHRDRLGRPPRLCKPVSVIAQRVGQVRQVGISVRPEGFIPGITIYYRMTLPRTWRHAPPHLFGIPGAGRC